jgi:hypothetical protein
VHFGDGPPYVLIAEASCAQRADGERSPGGASAPDQVRWFHSADRTLAESLAFRLQRELRVPRLA